MDEMRPNTQQQQDCRDSRAVSITVHTLKPNQRLDLPPCEFAVLVTEGLLYVVLDEDELALIPGEEVVIPAGQLQWAYNAGTDTAKIAALRR
jgi:quercetin dioxygenase-like cupin family protein